MYSQGHVKRWSACPRAHGGGTNAPAPRRKLLAIGNVDEALGSVWDPTGRGNSEHDAKYLILSQAWAQLRIGLSLQLPGVHSTGQMILVKGFYFPRLI